MNNLLDQGIYERLARLLTADTDDFNALVKAAGLDPARDFRYADLSYMNMQAADLRNFDFSYSDFRNVNVTDSWIGGACFAHAELIGTDLTRARDAGKANADFAVIQDAPFAPELVMIPGGVFTMGSDKTLEESPPHRVAILYPIAVARYPITCDEYEYFNNKYTPRKGRHPVTYMAGVDEYLSWLSAETGYPYRLLSEAEWEFVCRAGTTTNYWWGDDEPSPAQANFGSHVGGTTEVGSYLANPWGLFDTHGNVWELVEDSYHADFAGAPGDGTAWKGAGAVYTRDVYENGVYQDDMRVLRGGCWADPPADLRSASRSYQGAFRVVCRWDGSGYSAVDTRSAGPLKYFGDGVGFRVARAL